MFNFFKSREKNSSNSTDGLWLKGYRDSEWSELFSHQTSTGAYVTTEVSVESCHFDGNAYFCILRRLDNSVGAYQFLLIVALPHLEEMVWIVERIEDQDEFCLRKDAWHKEGSFRRPKVPEIDNAISIVQSYARLNNFSSPPPYMLVIAANKDKWMS
jgi:hypothetical protein